MISYSPVKLWHSWHHQRNASGYSVPKASASPATLGASLALIVALSASLPHAASAASAPSQFILWNNRGGTDNGLARLWVVDQQGNNTSYHDLVKTTAWNAVAYQAIDARWGKLLMAQNLTGAKFFQVYNVDLTKPSLQKATPVGPLIGPFDAVTACYWMNPDGTSQTNGTATVIWTSPTGQIHLIKLHSNGSIASSRLLLNYPGFRATSYQKLSDGQARLLLGNRNTGQVFLFFFDQVDYLYNSKALGPFPGYEAAGLEFVVDVNSSFQSTYAYGRLLLAANDTSGGYLYGLDGAGNLITPTLRYYGYWGISGWVAEAFSSPVPDVKVEVYVDNMTCTQPSDSTALNDRDEVYAQVQADGYGLSRNWRLPTYGPDDDYYEFFTNSTSNTTNFNLWTNQDQAPVGRPLLWSGTLPNFQPAQFLVVLREQDNKFLSTLKSALSVAIPAAQAAVVPFVPEAAGVFSGASGLANAIPDIRADDVIGVFSVRVRNHYGQIRAEWVAVNNINFGVAGMAKAAITSINTAGIYAAGLAQNGINACEFKFDGTANSKYRATAAVKMVNTVALRRQYLGYVEGGCNASNGTISMKDRFNQTLTLTSQFPPNNLATVRIQPSSVGRWVPWKCGSNQESVFIGQYPYYPNLIPTDLIMFGWRPGRDVYFWCFKEIPW